MTDESAPSLADDEAALVRYGQALVDAVDAVAEDWLRRLVAAHVPGLEGQENVAATLRTAATEAVEALQALLQLDSADQPVGPLEILRRIVHVPTKVLAEAQAPAVQRDEFSRSNFPEDVYGLTPASFADVDPTLHEPGLMWGAAKAHVHLRRRRELKPPRVVVLSADLMDRSKISAALPDAKIVRSVDKLIEAAADADLVLVDLARVSDPESLSPVTCRLIAFGSHVNEAELEAASAAGAEALPRSVFFRRLAAGDISRF